MLDKIAEIHYGQALDALDHAGTKLRDATRASFAGSTTRIIQFYKNGRWGVIKKGKVNTGQFRLGRRISHRRKKGLDKTQNMKSFITSNLMVDSLTMVVAGKHGTIRPKKRRDGKVEGSFKVDPVTKGSYAILQKLNYGDDSDSEYKKVRRTKQQEAFFKKTKFRKQNFIEKGRVNAMPEVMNIMTRKFEQLVKRQVDRANVSMRAVKTA